MVGKRVEHADRLRTLSGKNERKFHIVLKIDLVRCEVRAAGKHAAQGRVNAPPEVGLLSSE
jgi:hypothetical protein